jgi:IS66 C-terminal element
MSLVQSARICGHKPWAYLRDVLQRLPTQLNSRIEELLPHRWRPAAAEEPNRMKSIEALIEGGSDITVGAMGSIECAAKAADGLNALAMLVRRDGETLTALLKRLDRAIARYFDTGETTDEIHPPND